MDKSVMLLSQNGEGFSTKEQEMLKQLGSQVQIT